MRWQEIQMGMRVRAARAVEVLPLGYGGQTRHIQPGDLGTVRSVNTFRTIVRWDSGDYSAWFENYYLEDASVPVAPRVYTISDLDRPLGTKPDGDNYLPIDDPRLQWIWDDLGRYAEGRNWCSDYERLAEKVGIPGRKRTYDIERSFDTQRGAVRFTAFITARSEEEANRIADAMISTASEELP